MPSIQIKYLPIRSLRVGFVAIILVTAAVYLPIIDAGYIWDDGEYVTENPTVLEPGGILRIWLEPGSCPYYYPVTFSFFWFGHCLWGLHPLGFHLTNLGFHIFNACLLVVVLQKLKVPGAIFAGLLFALHPVQSASVAWVTELKNVLSETFCLLSLRLWIHSRDSSRPIRWLAVLAFLLGMLAKPIICSFPVILLLLVWWKSGDRWKRDLYSTLPFFAVSFVVSLFTLYWESKHRIAVDKLYELPVLERILLSSQSLLFYWGKLIWPNPLAAVYPRWNFDASSFAVFIFPLGVIAILAFLWGMRNRWGKGPLIAVLTTVITLAPILGIINFSGIFYSYVYTHHLYHSTPAFAALAAALVSGLLESSSRMRHALGLVCISIVLVVYAILTWRQTLVHKNERTLFEHNVSVYPESPQARVFLGSTLNREKNDSGSLDQYEAAIALSPLDPQAHYGMAEVLTRIGDSDRAFEHLKKAVEGGPTYSAGRFNLAWAYFNRADYPNAIVHFSELIRFRPDYWSAYPPLAEAYSKGGKEADAIETLESLLEIRPEDADAEYRLATLYLKRGDLQVSLSHFEAALRIDPDRGFQIKPKFAEELVKRARILREEGDLESAQKILSEAEKIWPSLSELKTELNPVQDQIPK